MCEKVKSKTKMCGKENGAWRVWSTNCAETVKTAVTPAWSRRRRRTGLWCRAVVLRKPRILNLSGLELTLSMFMERSQLLSFHAVYLYHPVKQECNDFFLCLCLTIRNFDKRKCWQENKHRQGKLIFNWNLVSLTHFSSSVNPSLQICFILCHRVSSKIHMKTVFSLKVQLVCLTKIVLKVSRN